MPSDHTFARVTMAMPDASVRAAGRLNALLYRATRGHVGGHFAHGPVLVLTTTGRHSGQLRRTTVLYQRDGDRLVVVGSNTGSDHPPAWAHNLLAHPDADVQIGAEQLRVRARLCEGAERDELWNTMNDLFRGFAEYHRKTSREFPVFVLEPCEAADRIPRAW